MIVVVATLGVLYPALDGVFSVIYKDLKNNNQSLSVCIYTYIRVGYIYIQYIYIYIYIYTVYIQYIDG